MADESEELSLTVPSCLHLVSAFLSMEPPDFLINLARVCGGGGGFITERVQRFIWDQCIVKADRKCYAPYLKSFLKKLIVEVESQGGDVLDELYEQYASYMTLLKDDNVAKGNSRILKCVSFLFPEECLEVPSCPKSMQLVIPLQCSLNMLEGDTGCSIWPSSLFLAEFILSCPEIFSNKSCFEVGSGVGLVGICLANVKASKVVLSDGDLSTLANMKLNLEQNQLIASTDLSARSTQNPNLVQCKYLPWEFATESELQEFMPDIVLGADVIYDPLCLPHLVHVLAALLHRERLDGIETPYNDDVKRSDLDDNDRKRFDAERGEAKDNGTPSNVNPRHASKKGAVAYIASVIRNIETFNCFLALADQGKLKVTDITETVKVFDLLPYMQSYSRSSIRLFTVTYLCK